LLLASFAAGCGGRSDRRAVRREPTALGHLWNQGRRAVGVALRHPDDVIEAAPADARRRPWILCDRALEAHGIDPVAENAAALEALRRRPAEAGRTFDAILVPGYTPLDQTTPLTEIHPIAVERLVIALEELRAGRAPIVVVSGGNVHPEGTPVNEALQMKAWLLARGVSPDRVIVEPCARHSHTNLRNAGRFLLAHGLSRAVIVTSRDQAMYFGRPRTSTFDARCLSDLGYVVGALQELDEHRVSFSPSGRTFDPGADPLDP
jgi:hypothetical protein